ncbi:hypothetical protein Salmuc_01737 [Salipiger mucosus DSM 16094]|uniref:Uncharacterized protein n=1 Tax=Salipiger mucosus DSM 16094 TaxID=1123237 RepID=S9QWJ7_9RHOB|nr:hypothetical protein Salmuc_01737 [Salipiger mucosus DSM 16094]
MGDHGEFADIIPSRDLKSERDPELEPFASLRSDKSFANLLDNFAGMSGDKDGPEIMIVQTKLSDRAVNIVESITRGFFQIEVPLRALQDSVAQILKMIVYIRAPEGEDLLYGDRAPGPRLLQWDPSQIVLAEDRVAIRIH